MNHNYSYQTYADWIYWLYQDEFEGPEEDYEEDVETVKY